MTLHLSATRKLLWLLVLALAVAGAGYLWWRLRVPELPPGIVAGNGRLEAVEVDVATKVAGRLLTLSPREGEQVQKQQVVATFDAEELAAQLRSSQAQVRQAREAVREARAGVRKAEVDVTLAGKTVQRTQELVQRGFVSDDRLDHDRNALQSAESGLAAARVRVAAAEAAVDAASAQGQSLAAVVNDTSLKAPIAGRVLYRLAEPGEVIAPGGKVLTLLDMSEVFMTVFLPTAEAGKLAIGSPARIVLDAWPGQVLPATVSFVSPRAQFTPKEVETRSEREKLMFRIKVRVEGDWLARHQEIVKAGMPGMAYLRVDPSQEWPAKLQLR